MRIWLPDPIYKAKPYALIFAAIILILVSTSKIAQMTATLFACFSLYIFIVRDIGQDSSTDR